jgi:amidase
VQLAVTRTVRDTAAVLDAVNGAGMIAEYWDLPTPPRTYREEIARPPGPMRIAVTGQGWSPGPVDAQHRATVDAIGHWLENMGHAVEEASPEFDYEALLEAYVKKCAVSTAHSIDVLAKATGVDPTSGVLEATTLAALRHGRELTAYDVYTADAILSATRYAMGSFFRDYEVLVTPTMTDSACRLGEMNADDPTLDIYTWQRIAFSYSPFPWPFNVTGQPAISLPLGETEAGMPIGVQLVGRIGAEATLLKLAAQLEQAMPWATRRPYVFVGAPARTGG